MGWPGQVAGSAQVSYDDGDGDIVARLRAEDRLPDLLDAEPPQHMTPVAKMLWAELLPAFLEARMLKTIDVGAFEALCEAYSECCRYREQIADDNYFYETRDQAGNVRYVTHPALPALQDADRRFRGWLVEFGMTPSSRAAMSSPRRGHGGVPPPNDDDLGLAELSDEERAALAELLERRRITVEATAHDEE